MACITVSNLKSLAHPDWPYTGTPHEWRGFVKKDGGPRVERTNEWTQVPEFARPAVYQKQNFGPELK
jgi:hypothetical protein